MDKILELMQDSEWHSTNEIEKKAEFYSLPKEKSKEIIRFLEAYEFIIYNKEKKKAKINPLGLTFLELPVDL
jgi:hypothetical protein